MAFPGKICKSQTEAATQIANVQLYVQYYYKYFDGQNFTNPLKDLTRYSGYGLSDKFGHSETILLKQVNVKLRDNLFMSTIGEQDLTYYDLHHELYAVNDFAYQSRFYSLNILLSTNVITNVREVKTYWQIISQLGGLLGILTAFNAIICSYFANKSLKQDLVD